MNNVTVAIPSYNTSTYIKECLRRFLKSSYINEIIISDDASESSDIEKLASIVDEMREETNKKIILLKNKKNIGIYENKIKLVKASSNNLVYVFDSDNIPQKNIDKIIKKIFMNNEENYIYLPSKIYQFTNSYIFTKLLSLFSKKYIVRFSKNNFLINKKMVESYFINNTKYTIDKHLMWVLGLSNFFVYKSAFLNKVPSNYGKINNINMSADFLAICFFYLSNGGKIYLLNNFYHFHRKRKDSAALILGDKFFDSIEVFKKKFID